MTVIRYCVHKHGWCRFTDHAEAVSHAHHRAVATGHRHTIRRTQIWLPGLRYDGPIWSITEIRP